MRCEFLAHVNVLRYAVFCEMAWPEKRPEVGLLCRAAQESGGRLTVPVIQNCLPGVSDVGASNIIAWCRDIGLCKPDGTLSRAGHTAAQNNEVPIPEQGVYDLWIISHPLTGNRILHAERMTPNNEGRMEEIRDLEAQPDRDVVFESVKNQTLRYLLRPRQGAQAPLRGIRRESQSNCSIQWALDFLDNHNEWHLEGTLEGNTFKSAGHSIEVDLQQLFASLARDHLGNRGRWDAPQKRFLVGFDGLTQAEQEEFRKNYLIQNVRIENRGSFERATLRDVPIGPKSPQDAQSWAEARLERRLGESGKGPVYRSRSDLRRLFAELIEDTPLAPHAPALPSHEKMLRRYRPSPMVFWALAAGVDLAPVEPMAEELSPLVIGRSGTAGRSRPDIVRIPYRGGWSMSDVVERLLAGSTPQRILLADRYVRTPAQRDSLKLFCATLRSIHPDVSVDLYTQTEEMDKKVRDEIQGILGPTGKLQGYEELFGAPKGFQPHARYLLIDPDNAKEAPFGWQMDNSPLDGRADGPAEPKTPLRWRDFSAVRLQREEIPEELRRWFDEARL